MITRRYQIQRSNPYLWGIRLPFQWATLFLLCFTVCFAAIALSWLVDLGGIGDWFMSIHQFQRQAADWFEAPSPSAGWVLSLVMLLATQVIIRLSPQPKVWSRLLVVAILLALVIRYVAWRSLSTLNLSTPVNGIMSLGLFGLEMLAMAGYATQLFLMVRERDRRREADRYAVAVETGSFLPTVDIFIPTYNESAVILQRTIIGCQALDYPNKQIYLLDDGKRTDVQRLAAEMDCHYMIRASNRHAKAGNLNHAIAHTNGELIVVFDADFIPTKNFLTRTVGFFQNRMIGLVQTHQCFYNPDPLACNLGIEEEIPHENETYSRHYQLVRDGANSSPCYGSSFVMRRSALEEIGGFVTKSVSEDMYTGIRLTAQGYQVIYLDENLSAGLVPEDIPSLISQRQRWGRGSLQAFFLKENPLTIPGLSLRQRIAYLEGILQWLSSPTRIVFLIVPIAAAFLGIAPFTSTLNDWLYFFLPLYLVQWLTFSWLNHRANAALALEIYSIATCFPVAATVVQTLVSPFSTGFRVTPKGTNRTKTVFQWKLAAPIIVLLLLTVASVLWQCYGLIHPNVQTTNLATREYFKLGLIWNGYNCFILVLAILSLFDIPKPAFYKQLERRYPVKVQMGDRWIDGITRQISELEAEITLSVNDRLVQSDTPVMLHFPDQSLTVNAHVAQITHHPERSTINLAFDSLSPEQHRRLVELLFCTPGQWPRQQAPNELHMLWILCRSLVHPRGVSRAT